MEERVRKKKYETRKSINVIINICKELDNIEGVEYNLTVESSDLKEYINSECAATAASLITLRVTQHKGPERYGPWYICVVGELNIWTFKPEAIELIGLGPTKGTFETLCMYSYSVDTTEIVERIVSNLKTNLK